MIANSAGLSVVAFICTYLVRSRADESPMPLLPPILGTGFAVGPDGLFVTNAHVVEAWIKISQMLGANEEASPVAALYFRPGETAVSIHLFEVLGAISPGPYVGGPGYRGPTEIDLALVRVAVRGIPPVQFASDDSPIVHPGDEVATIGFPLGEDLLVHNREEPIFGPVLQRGVISAVSPGPCRNPISFLVNIMVQGGASGSPVFRTSDGSLVGVMRARRFEFLEDHGSGPAVPQRLPTNFSVVIPAHLVRMVAHSYDHHPSFPNLPAEVHDIAESRPHLVTEDLRSRPFLEWTDL